MGVKRKKIKNGGTRTRRERASKEIVFAENWSTEGSYFQDVSGFNSTGAGFKPNIDNISHKDVFELFLDDTIIMHVVDYTNERLKEGIKGTNKQEVKDFILILLALGIARYPWESYAWQGHNEFYKPCKFITERMTFSRFQQLKMSISFDDEFLTKYINFKFRDLWNVGLILTVDETLFPYKGSNVGRRTCVKGIVMEFLEDVLKYNTKPIYKNPGVIDEDEDEDED